MEAPFLAGSKNLLIAPLSNEAVWGAAVSFQYCAKTVPGTLYAFGCLNICLAVKQHWTQVRNTMAGTSGPEKTWVKAEKTQWMDLENCKIWQDECVGRRYQCPDY